MSSNYGSGCEYCWPIDERTGAKTFKACGMTRKEHKQMAKVREAAEAKAHALVVAARAQEQLPRALIRELHKGAGKEVRQLLDQHNRAQR